MASERDLTHAVKEAKAELMALLLPAERKTVRSWTEPARTFEDAAREIAHGPYIAAPDPRAELVGKALAGFQAAVNHLWLDLWSRGVPGRLVSQWKGLRLRAWRRLIVVCGEGELESEAAVALRWVITQKSYDPARGASFATYARQHVWDKLDAFAKRSLTLVGMTHRQTQEFGPGRRDVLLGSGEQAVELRDGVAALSLPEEDAR